MTPEMKMYTICAVAVAFLVITSGILMGAGAALVEEKDDTFSAVATAWGVIFFLVGIGLAYGIVRVRHTGQVHGQVASGKHTAPIENVPSHPVAPHPQAQPVSAPAPSIMNPGAPPAQASQPAQVAPPSNLI